MEFLNSTHSIFHLQVGSLHLNTKFLSAIISNKRLKLQMNQNWCHIDVDQMGNLWSQMNNRIQLLRFQCIQNDVGIGTRSNCWLSDHRVVAFEYVLLLVFSLQGKIFLHQLRSPETTNCLSWKPLIEIKIKLLTSLISHCRATQIIEKACVN